MRGIRVFRFGFGPFVLVPESILERMFQYQSGDEQRREAGGILIGCYRGRDLELLDITVPMPRDVRGPFHFDRQDRGHQDAAMRAWRVSDRKDTMIGEWHTHPEPVPSPSDLDRQTWRTVAARVAPRPAVFGIQGQKEARFWLSASDVAVELTEDVLDARGDS